MVFSSTIFLFVYLPIVVILYVFTRTKYRNLVLFASSLVFYFWGETWLGIYLIISVVVNFTIAIFLELLKRMGDRGNRLQLFILSIAVVYNLGMLGYYKYCNFFVDNIVNHFNLSFKWATIALPIGISFYTFQALSYVIDVYRNDVKATNNIIDFGCYLTFFPQLIAGPIVRYIDVSKQLIKQSINFYSLSYGVERFIIGLAKKVLIANSVGRGADIIFGSTLEQINPLAAWLGALCYSLQIYFDFSGYSDMAIGLGRIFGFEFLENFNYPYISRSIQDFWRRWHISLSTWFRDYLYIPLGGSKVGPIRLYINLIIVFTLCGFWHGASWTFIIWGLYHGFFLVVERIGFSRLLERTPGFLAHSYTLFVVLFGWVIFRSDNMSSLYIYIKTMFGFGGNSILNPRVFLDKDMVFALIAGAILSLPVKNIFDKFIRIPPSLLSVGKTACLTIIFTFSILRIFSSNFNPFLYFRF
jgi:alginate O-acetyltransferase complex protein AlgI